MGKHTHTHLKSSLHKARTRGAATILAVTAVGALATSAAAQAPPEPEKVSGLISAVCDAGKAAARKDQAISKESLRLQYYPWPNNLLTGHENNLEFNRCYRDVFSPSEVQGIENMQEDRNRSPLPPPPGAMTKL